MSDGLEARSVSQVVRRIQVLALVYGWVWAWRQGLVLV